MIIYPPYKKWKTVINDPVEFEQYLADSIETNCTNYKAKYKGRLSSSEFIIERKLHHHNFNRPQIRGIITCNSNNEQELTLTIESRKSLLYVVSVFSIIIGLTSIFRQDVIVLMVIPIIALWFWFVGLILHLLEIRKTKLEIVLILENACKSNSICAEPESEK